LNRDEGLSELRSFFSERWKGIRPLLWGAPMIQEELQEALHCGLFCLELGSEDEKDDRP
jgi:glycerol-3-phosphate dehydrogenase